MTQTLLFSKGKILFCLIFFGWTTMFLHAQIPDVGDFDLMEEYDEETDYHPALLPGDDLRKVNQYQL